MKRFYLTKEQFNNRIANGDEFNHMKNVMRMNKGDDFIAFIDDENDYYCKILDIKKDFLTFDLLKSEHNTKNPKLIIDIFQALSKGEKMELVAQKTTEIGIRNFYPLYVKNCDVKPNTNKTSRLEKIVISACKQCGRSRLPIIKDIITLKDCVNLLNNYDLVLFANETERNSRIFDTLNQKANILSIALIVGPEGGFTPDEINALSEHSVSISLGSRILRTETAAIYLTSIVNDFYRN